MNIHHLELFYYVARHGGIMPAVRHMPYGIQQPAVSGQILQLEADLGVRLFQRRPFALTAAGAELFAHIEPFFRDLGAVADRIRGSARQVLRLAAPETALRLHLPEILQQLRGLFPLLKVTLRATRADLIPALFERDQIDFAIAPLPEEAPARLQTAELLDLPLALLVRKTERFTEAASLLDALADGAWLAPLIAQRAEEIAPREFRRMLAKRGLEWPASIEVEALDLVEIYVAAGFGAGLTVLTPRQPLPRGVRALPLEDCARMKICTLWQGSLSPAADALLQIVKARALQLQEP